jgi:hypothetical protein
MWERYWRFDLGVRQSLERLRGQLILNACMRRRAQSPLLNTRYGKLFAGVRSGRELGSLEDVL